MKAASKNYNYALRLPAADAKAVNEVCRKSKISFNQVVSLCVRKALPSVRAALLPNPPRITNVEPLPDEVLRAAYAEPDDDTDSIQLLMANQVKTIEE
jgi:hypothetical protein